jgi:hypothetical protein
LGFLTNFDWLKSKWNLIIRESYPNFLNRSKFINIFHVERRFPIGHPRSLIRNHAVRLPTLLQVTNSEQHGSWSDCAVLDPCWSQMRYVGFVRTRLNYISSVVFIITSTLNFFKSFNIKNTDYLTYNTILVYTKGQLVPFLTL